MSVLGAHWGPGFQFNFWSLKPINGGPAVLAMTTVSHRQNPFNHRKHLNKMTQGGGISWEDYLTKGILALYIARAS